jgi:glucose/arabinose dehydrogenase
MDADCALAEEHGLDHLAGMRTFLIVGTLALSCAVGVSCTSSNAAAPGGIDAGDGGRHDASLDGGPLPEAAPWDAAGFDAAALTSLCKLPGSIVFMNGQRMVIPGGSVTQPDDLHWLTLPDGFCVHYYGHVPYARQIRFAPGGELFVSSPSSGTTGGGNNGNADIEVLPDDDKDGYADAPIQFLNSLPSVQGLHFVPNYFYYQDSVNIRRMPYTAGQRAPMTSELVVTINAPQSAGHWPKVMDTALDGTLYVTNGGDQGDQCTSSRPFLGGILAIDGTPGGRQVSKGFRNPIAMRCRPDHNVCLAAELVLDYSAGQNGREKLLPIEDGSDWGYPCCATQNVPYSNVTYKDNGQVPDCSGVQPESTAFIVAETPFGFDYELGHGAWPGTWSGRIYLTLHGAFGSWQGARMVAIATDPATGLPLPSSDTGGSEQNMVDFATGWDDGTLKHGRPAAVTFAPDGRLFLADDVLGQIIWIAPAIE